MPENRTPLRSEASTKAKLAKVLRDEIVRKQLSQTEVARITGLTQPKVSLLCRSRLENISLERLMQALVALDQRIDIVVSPASQHLDADIIVAA